MGEAFLLVTIWGTLGLLVAIPTMKVFHLWLIDKSWNTGIASLALFIILAGLSIVWSSTSVVGAIIYALFLVLATVLLPVFENRAETTKLKAMRDEDIARYRKTLQFDPNNAAAHAFLADAYAEREQFDEAIAEYEQAITLERYQADSERYKYRLKHVRAEKDGTTRKPIVVCEHCHCDTPAETPLCRKCGQPLSLGFFHWLIRPENWKTILKQSAISISVVVGLGIIFSSLPIEVKGCVLIATLIVGAFLVLRKMEK